MNMSNEDSNMYKKKKKKKKSGHVSHFKYNGYRNRRESVLCTHYLVHHSRSIRLTMIFLTYQYYALPLFLFVISLLFENIFDECIS